MTRPVAVIILDGFGLAPDGPGNAVALARTPVFDGIWAHRPRTTLNASGEAVGLPAGQMGNSEVGHMNIGAGRVVRQSLTYLRALIEDGSFFRSPVLLDAYRAAGTAGTGTAGTGKSCTLHLLGLVSDGGVHSDLGHLLALLELAAREGVGRVRLHAFSDGRDSPPDAARGYLATVEEAMARLRASGIDARIASVTGRYYAMDRDKRWERTRAAFEAIVCGVAPHVAASALETVEAAYARGETDEFIVPTLVLEPGATVGVASAPQVVSGAAAGGNHEPAAAVRGGRIDDGDAVVFFNFRADRARQFSHALLGGPDFAGFERCATPRVEFASLMEYDKELGAKFAFALPELDNGLSEVIAAAGLHQYHTAETEKYAHVTYFFNLRREEPFALEERLLVPSPKVATYDLQPAMSAPALTEATVKRLRERADDFVLLNYANPDMVGHTGVIAAAVQACEAVDAGLGQLLEAVLAKHGAALVIADHGNAEQMLTAAGEPHTAHTTNPVPCVLVSDDPALEGVRLRSGGALCDVAPTVLALLGLTQPPEMKGESLLLS